MITAPRLVSVYFPGRDAPPDMFDRLARVLDFTARAHCPGWRLEVQAIGEPTCRASDGTAAYEANTQKLDHWCATVEAAADGERILLVDTDTMVLRPLDPVWSEDFDVAYTTRPSGCRLPLNAGVVFVRVSDRVRVFLRSWRDVNRRMLADRLFHLQWRRRYGGLNQAALGCVLETAPPDGLTTMALPCAEWNCEESAWNVVDPAFPRIVHVKSSLRKAIFHRDPVSPPILHLAKVWRRQERAATEAATC